MTWINLNKIPPKILLLTNLLVIILFIAAIFMLLVEIRYVQEYGGQCVNNPMAWAEQYAREEKGLNIDCSCKQPGDFYIQELNKSRG